MKINKQFDQLAQGVNVWYPNGYPSAEGGDAEWLNYAIFEKQDLQKFAESIVTECIQQLWSEECNVSDLAFEEFTRKANTIKERFGML